MKLCCTLFMTCCTIGASVPSTLVFLTQRCFKNSVWLLRLLQPCQVSSIKHDGFCLWIKHDATSLTYHNHCSHWNRMPLFENAVIYRPTQSWGSNKHHSHKWQGYKKTVNIISCLNSLLAVSTTTPTTTSGQWPAILTVFMVFLNDSTRLR
jgi:hypothetical protein